MRRILTLICCIGLLGAARGQTKLYYWFDTDNVVESSITMNSLNNLTIDIDVSGLTEGIHKLNIMVEDTIGKQSSSISKIFYRSSKLGEDLHYRCWFDDDEQNVQSGELGNGAITLDVSGLTDGLHKVNVQVYSSFLTAPKSSMFLKIPQVVGSDQLTFACLIDDKLYEQQTVSGKQEVIHINLDVAPIPQGIHKIQIMLATESGAVTCSYTTYFYRVVLQSEINVSEMMYSIDGKLMPPVTATTAVDGKLHFDIDVSSLPDGLHCINYAMIGGTRVYGISNTNWFYKIPLGGEGIIGYDYWLNDRESELHHVDLEERVKSYRLVSLLPVEKVPIRSTLFHFAYKNDTMPVIYAKNDFHVRFWEAGGRLTMTENQFVDERVCDTINVETLKDKNVLLPTYKNEIKWYSINTKRGDSIAIKTNKACLLQIFSPSGKEVYSADALHSSTWGGCHTHEAGTFYIALHDVMDSTSKSITLFSKHIDRYALFEYSPHRVGEIEGSMFTFDLYGNGLDKLVDAYLRKDDNVIYVDSIYNSTINKASLIMSFPSNAIPYDVYDLVLVFEENEIREDLIRERAVTIEKPSYGDIEVKYSIHSQFDNPYRLTVSIRNIGNIRYSWIPFNIAFDNPKVISDIQFANFSVAVPLNIDTLGYQFATYTNNLLGKNIDGGVLFLMIPQLSPDETKTYDFNITIEENKLVHFYAWTGTPVERDSTITRKKLKRKAPRESQLALNILSAGDIMENVTGHIPNLPDNNLPNPAALAGRAGNIAIKTGVTIAGIYNGLDHAGDMARLKQYGIDPSDPLYDEIADLHPPVATPGHIWGGCAGELLDHFMGCQRECAEQPNPDPGTPHSVLRRSAHDPNDIIGYISDAGSFCMSSDIDELIYTIEFENDTIFASASAHTVVIRDTLDATRFDLTSFVATEVTIGDRKMNWETPQGGSQTLDLRTIMNVVAQVSLNYDQINGIAEWTISSLDPMSMEPITDPDLGVLPVNFDGNGQGTVSFRIGLKDKFDDGTQIADRAEIIFDTNAPLFTPLWVNTVDAYKPKSRIEAVEIKDDSLHFHFSASDNRSGVWQYSLYARTDSEHDWELAVQSDMDTCLVPMDSEWTQFYVIATDSAGNEEIKNNVVEFSLDGGLVVYHTVTVNSEHCSVSGSGSYVDGTTVILNVTPDECYRFIGWSDSNTDNPRTIVIEDDVELTAFTEMLRYKVNTQTDNPVKGSTQVKFLE